LDEGNLPVLDKIIHMGQAWSWGNSWVWRNALKLAIDKGRFDLVEVLIRAHPAPRGTIIDPELTDILVASVQRNHKTLCMFYYLVQMLGLPSDTGTRVLKQVVLTGIEHRVMQLLSIPVPVNYDILILAFERLSTVTSLCMLDGKEVERYVNHTLCRLAFRVYISNPKWTILLKRLVEFNTIDVCFDHNVLLLSALTLRNMEVVEWLLAFPAVLSSSMTNLIERCIRMNRADSLRILLCKTKYDISEYNNRALSLAMLMRKVDIVELLLRDTQVRAKTTIGEMGFLETWLRDQKHRLKCKKRHWNRSKVTPYPIS
jgi:hypothetical protein